MLTDLTRNQLEIKEANRLPTPLPSDNFKTITIRWPAGSKMPTIRGKWKRLPDGRIEATYTRDELAAVEMVYGEIYSLTE
jgi:hypothetical protein